MTKLLSLLIIRRLISSRHSVAAWLLLTAVIGVAGLSASAVSVGQLRCEYLKDPAGIDTPQPRLSWVLDAGKGAARNLAQSSYQILVSGNRNELQANQGDLWDSGQVKSDQSIQVRYAGKALASEQEAFWKVRVWDNEGKPSAWSEPARWTMGLLNPSDWHGKWIGLDEPAGENPAKKVLGDAQWIWFPEGQPEKAAPVGTRYFRKAVTLPADRAVKRATLFFSADNSGEFFINGQKAGSASDFHAAARFDVTGQLVRGQNLLAVSVRNEGSDPNPAGLIALLRIEFTQGEPLIAVTDSSWTSGNNEAAGWKDAGFDEAGWQGAKKLGPAGMAPWGEITGPEDRRLPARMLRRDFAVERGVRRALAHICGLGLSEFYLNGQKVGDQVLSPGLTDYTKRAFYVTYDVTKELRKGANAAGVMLGNGRFYAPRSTVPTGTTGYGYPKLMFQMRIEYEDGTKAEVVSDEAWRLTTAGPIRANNEYDGEEYDARQEMPGWIASGFDAAQWQPAQGVAAPGGVLAAQMIAPIRVMETLKPIALTQPSPEMWIFDMGQNMVGWCRLKVSGPPGTEVRLRHAETLKADGTLYLDNIRSAKVTDSYTLKGKGTEVYEPRFTYHGFRYVEMTGYPGKPSLSSLEGRVVHDALETAGEFTCSNPLLNRIYRNIVWGVSGNYRSIPTDCPQRDERQGWLGDRSAESKGETYLFNTAALYAKWLQDMADAQEDTGSVSDVCPAYWPIYSDNVTWPSSTVIIPSALREQYADEDIVARHYASAKKWVEYMRRFITDGIIAKDSYGDWCVPPEEQKLIHSNDPKRRTDKALLATAYFYYDARLMARYATLLGKPEDAQRFTALAEELKAAFNGKFFRAETGQYDNGSQTSCVLPLAFGLVPDGQRERVFDYLVRKITQETQGHIGTGLIGGQWLMRVLTGGGRADLAYTIATQKDYPSWGYMVEKGATTIWELWNGDTADPAMNSGNHVMLVGDLGIWLYENLGGIKPDPEQPGFKHIIMRPEPVGDLRFVKASHRSPYGLIASDWQRQDGDFRWKITIPANTTATVYVPAASAERVTESGKPVAQARGVTLVKEENSRAVFSVGSGNYSFESR
ncbi:MAG: family 78 glycoside hydrolase catalytic domain [Limisphaerales bacterium]